MRMGVKLHIVKHERLRAHKKAAILMRYPHKILSFSGIFLAYCWAITIIRRGGNCLDINNINIYLKNPIAYR